MAEQRVTGASLSQASLTEAHQTIMHQSQITEASAEGILQLPCPRSNLPLPRELRDQ
jgi:hypothetical protein